MACGVNFSDSSTVTWSTDAAGNVVATAVGGGTGGCCNISLVTSFDQNTGVLTTSVTDSNGTVTDTVVLPTGSTATPCTVAGPNGLTGTQSGEFVDSCAPLAMPAGNNPESSFPAAAFPNCWRQRFTGATSGDEYWIIKNDVNGVPEWHQIA